MGMDSLVSQSDTRTEPYHDTIQNLHTLPALSASQEVSAIYPVMSRVVDVTIKNTRANHSCKSSPGGLLKIFKLRLTFAI